MKLLLDTNVLARLCHPTGYRDVQEWFRALLVRPVAPDILVSVLADYELRRKLVRIHANASVRQLDKITQSITYLPITPETIRKASELWARMRTDIPSEQQINLSDADILIAAQAALEGAVLVTSDRELRRIPDIEVKDWSEIPITNELGSGASPSSQSTE